MILSSRAHIGCNSGFDPARPVAVQAGPGAVEDEVPHRSFFDVVLAASRAILQETPANDFFMRAVIGQRVDLHEHQHIRVSAFPVHRDANVVQSGLAPEPHVSTSTGDHQRKSNRVLLYVILGSELRSPPFFGQGATLAGSFQRACHSPRWSPAVASRQRTKRSIAAIERELARVWPWNFLSRPANRIAPFARSIHSPGQLRISSGQFH